MMFKSQNCLTLLVGLIMPLLSQCDFSAKPLIIASHTWPGYELMFLARGEGWLPQQGLILQETPSATASLQALAEGRADGAALTLDEALRARAQGIDLSIVLVFDLSAGADKVLGKPGTNNLTALAGKRIGVEQSALGALMLYKTLEAAGLQTSDITTVQLNIDQHLSAWHKGQIDALITYDPVAGQLLDQDARLLFDSRKLPDTVFDVLAIKQDALEQKPAMIAKLVEGHFRGLQHFRSNPQDAAYRMAARLQVPGNQALNNFRGLDLPDVYANRKFLAPDSVLIQAARTLSTLLVKEHYIQQEDTLNHLVNAEFLPQAE